MNSYPVLMPSARSRVARILTPARQPGLEFLPRRVRHCRLAMADQGTPGRRGHSDRYYLSTVSTQSLLQLRRDGL